MGFLLRTLREEDLPEVRDILNLEIAESFVIYTEDAKTAEGMRAWFSHMKKEDYPMLAALAESGELAGFAYGDTYRSLSSYRTTAEVSLYVKRAFRGKKLGGLLLEGLIEEARLKGLHALVSVIDSENTPSIHLHEAYGFMNRGSWPEIARKFSSWREALFYQKIL